MIKMETYDGVASLFLDEANKMLERGYYFLPLPYDWALTGWQERRKNFPIHDLIPAGTLRRYLRIVARENKRPFVQLWKHHRYDRRADENGNITTVAVPQGLVVEIPKRKSLAPLVHCLIQAGYMQTRYQTIWLAVIPDQEFAEQYLTFLHEREEFRAALRLPPKVTEMKKAA